MREHSAAPAHSAPARRAFLLTWAFLAAVTVLALLTPRHASGPPAQPPVPAPAPTPRPSPPPTETPQPPPLSPAEYDRLTRVIDDYLAGEDCRLSLALHDLASGATYSYRAGETYTTASLVKLNILVLLLLRAEDEGRELSAEEERLAAEMIRYSDNDATNDLYARIGFDAGFARGNERLGLHATRPSGRGVWGATETTAADQLRLLRIVFTGDSPLSERSRDYASQLLGTVAPEQAWGISVAASEGDTVELKNGWVPRSSDGDRWVLTSAGRVAGAEHEYLIVVLSDRHRDYAGGIARIEHVVAEVAAALSDATRQ